MNIDKLKYDSTGPYVEYKHKSGVQIGQTCKTRASIKNCLKCGVEFAAIRTSKFCSYRCGKIERKWSDTHKNNIRISKMGEKNPSFSGGKRISKSGYVLVLDRDNTSSNSRGYILEHRLVMEKHIGRKLKKSEHIHHINEIKTDNRIDNLKIMSASEHSSHHIKQTQKNWLYIKQKNICCPHCKSDINLEAMIKISKENSK